MAVITNRPTKIIIDDEEYPGFISFSGDDAPISQEGLMPFQGKILIQYHPNNPRSLDPRTERATWCFGKEIKIYIKNANDLWVLHPRGCVWYYTGQYDYQTRQLTINCGCLIYLLKNRSIEDFKEPQDLIETTTTEKDPETGEEKEVKKDKYWWEEWSEPGEVTISSVVSTILGKLGLSGSGSAVGKVRTPLVPSGSLLQFIGELVYKSRRPSFMWCDRDGVIHTDKLPTRSGVNILGSIDIAPVFDDNDYTFIIGTDRGDEIDYKALHSAIEPIKSLIAIGRWQEEPSTIDNPGEDEALYAVCAPYTEEGSETMYDPSGDPNTDKIIAEGDRCEYYFPGKKVVTEWKNERKGLVFPTTTVNHGDYIRSYESTVTQYFNPSTCLLYKEVKVTKEPIGVIYSAWLANYPNRILTIASNNETNASQSLSFYSDQMAFATQLHISTKETTIYVYDAEDVVKTITTTTEEPQSKILTDYPIFNEFLVTTKQDIEEWGQNGNQQTHRKKERTAWQVFSRESVSKLEETLVGKKLAVYPTPGELVLSGQVDLLKFPWFVREGDVEGSSTVFIGTDVTDATDEDIYLGVYYKPQVSAEQRLALHTKTTQEINSQVGFANPPKAEKYCSVKDALSENNNNNPGDYVEKRWSGCGDIDPPREINDVGEVYDKSVLDAIAEFLYFLKQGESNKQIITLPLPEALIENYKPIFTCKVVEPNGQVITFLANGCVFTIEGQQNIVEFSGIWLGNSTARPISSVDGQWLAF